MTEQLNAEKFVREAIPELMELSFGCRVKYGTSYTTVWQVLLAENSKEPNHYNTVDVRGASNYLRDIQSSEIIGHPIALHHWLSVLGERLDESRWHLKSDGRVMWEDHGVNFEKLKFNLTTGQPNSPQDYANFNQIVNN